MKNATSRRINSSPSAMDYQDVASLVSVCSLSFVCQHNAKARKGIHNRNVSGIYYT